MKRRRHKHPTLTPELPTDSSHDYILLCVCCGKETGEKMNFRKSLADPVKVFGPDPSNWKMRHGVCKSCDAELKKGGTIFYSHTRGVILNKKGSDQIIDKFRGGYWQIPESEMDKILGPSTQKNANED